MKRPALQNAQTRCQGQRARYTGKPPLPLRYPRAQPSPQSLPQPSQRAGRAWGRQEQTVPPGEPGPISPGAPCPRLAARRSPSPASARVPRRGHPRNFPGSLRTLFLPAGGKRALAPSVQRGRGGGQPASLLPPAPARPPAEASPRLPHCTAAPRRATPCRAVRGARRCPPAPPSPSPAGGMSAGEAKEYLARREIPQLFEVGEAERGGGAGWRGAFSPRRGGAPRWDPRGGQRAEGGWKDGAARGCGAPALRGEPRRGGLAPAPRRAGGRCRPMAAPRGPGWGLPAAEPAGERLPAARLPAGSAGGRAAAPALLQPPGEGANLGARRAKDPRGRAAEEFRRGVSFGFSPGFRRSGRRTKPTTAQWGFV